MSVPSPAWRLAPRGYFFHASSLPIRTHRRCRPFSVTTSRAADDNIPDKRPNPVLDEYLRNNPKGSAALVQQGQLQAGGPGSGGDLSASSIFEDERRAAEMQQQQLEKDEKEAAARDGRVPLMRVGSDGRDASNLAQILDPVPNARRRWERKQVIQMVRRGGRLNKTQFIKRTEPEHLVKSHNMKTSVKKLGALARQIQGKTIDDAITQMRFSKKKVAEEVLKQLEFARDEAVVMRGMGLGSVQLAETSSVSEEGEEGEETLAIQDGAESIDVETSSLAIDSPLGEVVEAEEPVEIQLKDGKRHRIADSSAIYIDQAWVGRGPYGTLPDPRARGRMFVMRTPWTSITLLLKEEATRIRKYEEREAKRRRQKLGNVWVHLPDRPIQTKQQWYSW